MILLFVLIVVLLIGLTAAAVMGKIGGFMAGPTSSQSFSGVPDGVLSAGALAHVHFDQALRGYRMNQVDEVIDALVARVRGLEAEVAARSPVDTEPPAAVEPDVDDTVAGSTVAGSTVAGSTVAGSMVAGSTDIQER